MNIDVCRHRYEHRRLASAVPGRQTCKTSTLLGGWQPACFEEVGPWADRKWIPVLRGVGYYQPYSIPLIWW